MPAISRLSLTSFISYQPPPCQSKSGNFSKIYKNTLNFAKKSIQIYQNPILEDPKALRGKGVLSHEFLVLGF
jgi:hypothetical protein